MDISKWPLHQIMQLPDYCFGQRWPIELAVAVPDVNSHFVISPGGLPETCVIWEVMLRGPPDIGTSMDVTLSLGDQLPADDAAFAVMERVFPDCVSRTYGAGTWEVSAFTPGGIVSVRKAVRVAGRRFVVRFDRVQGSGTVGNFGVVISSVPREIPDSVLSDRSKSRPDCPFLR